MRCATKNFSLLRTYAKSPLVSAKTRVASGGDLNFVIKINNSVWIKSLIDQEVTKITNSLGNLQKVNLESFTESQLRHFKSHYHFQRHMEKEKCINA